MENASHMTRIQMEPAMAQKLLGLCEDHDLFYYGLNGGRLAKRPEFISAPLSVLKAHFGDDLSVLYVPGTTIGTSRRDSESEDRMSFRKIAVEAAAKENQTFTATSRDERGWVVG
jgi:hypothetical protein